MKVYLKDGQIATKNLTPGISVYGEELIQEKEEYRIWNPRRSKLAAALLNGLENLDISEDAKVLYLGASTGTTVSHISDIVTDGRIYAVEFSPTTAKKLVRLARQRTNIAPILGDATKPKNYLNITEKTDIVYCDVAQPTQSQLFMKNMNLIGKDDAIGALMIKPISEASKLKATSTVPPGVVGTNSVLAVMVFPLTIRAFPADVIRTPFITYVFPGSRCV